MKSTRFLQGLILLATIMLAACAPKTVKPAADVHVIDAYVTPAATPWLAKLFGCTTQTLLVRLNTPELAKINIRIGQPTPLTGSAFQIASADILVVANPASPIQTMTIEQVRDLFAGRGDPAVQVWVYAPDADVQTVFDQAVMQGSSVTSNARLASGPQEMLDAVAANPNAIGILPRSWHNGTVREVYAIKAVPVLAITESEPQGDMLVLVSCLQKK